MVNGLFYCATLRIHRTGHTHLCKQERKCPTLVRRRLNKIHTVLGRAILAVGANVELKVRSTEHRSVIQPLLIPLVIHSVRRTYVAVRLTDELLCSKYKWVSRFQALCICTRWTGEC